MNKNAPSFILNHDTQQDTDSQTPDTEDHPDSHGFEQVAHQPSGDEEIQLATAASTSCEPAAAVENKPTLAPNSNNLLAASSNQLLLPAASTTSLQHPQIFQPVYFMPAVAGGLSLPQQHAMFMQPLSALQPSGILQPVFIVNSHQQQQAVPVPVVCQPQWQPLQPAGYTAGPSPAVVLTYPPSPHPQTVASVVQIPTQAAHVAVPQQERNQT